MTEKSDHTIWLDLTMLVHWHGNLTGIQRVEYNLASRFAKRPDVRFCVFDKARRQLVPYDFAALEAKVEALQSPSKDDVSGLEVELERTSYPSLVLRSMKQLARKVTPHIIKKQARKVINARTKAARRQSDEPAVVLSDQDLLMILSGDWSDDIFADTMTANQKRHGFKIIQVIYDMLPYTQPQYFVPGMTQQFTAYMAKIFAISDSILAISKATKSDVVDFQKAHSLKPTPVEVFRLGDDFAKYQPVQPKLDVKPGHYILCVGTVEARKNHMLLYYVVKEALRTRTEIPTIVILGKRGWLVDNFFYLVENDPVMRQKLLFLHNASDQELAWLFENCQLTVYQSFFEGWGLPIAESLARGKYCLASSVSSMPEVAGDVIDYFSPSDPVKLLDLITKYSADPELLKTREQHIKTHYHPTKWDDTYISVERFVLGRLS